MSKSVKIGIILIIAAFLLLLSQVGLLPGQSFMFLLGLGFIAAYALLGARKDYGNVGFLIPGTILLAIATYSALSEGPRAESVSPALFFVALGISFLAVFIVHTFWFKDAEHGRRFWPLYPAGGLFAFSILVQMASSGIIAASFSYINYIWVAVLFGLGVWLIISGRKKGK